MRTIPPSPSHRNYKEQSRTLESHWLRIFRSHRDRSTGSHSPYPRRPVPLFAYPYGTPYPSRK